MGVFHLYIDDSGVRTPVFKPDVERRDNMDYFALGGIMVNEKDVEAVLGAHSDLFARWKLKGPLHSTKIRGRRKQFAWLAIDAATEAEFLLDLEKTILELPIVGTACVVDRPGYVGRYKGKYEQPWRLCKTAYAILIERAVKFVKSNGHRLKIFYEEAGENEDRDLEEYNKLLRSEGMPFDKNNAKPYDELRPEDFRSLIAGEPQRITKKVPMVQFSDLILYPIAKGGYDPTYRPYARLIETNRLIDCCVSENDKPKLGIKYSCFDRKE